MKKQLVAQFMLEALVTNLISIIIAIILLFLIKDMFAALTDMPISGTISRIYWIIPLILVVTGILISGLAPALYLASYKPIDLFKGIRTASATNLDMRKILGCYSVHCLHISAGSGSYCFQTN